MRLRLFLPSFVLILVAAAWCAFWFYAQAEAARQIDRFTAAQASQGRQFSCTDRSIGGFPFRLELRCGRSALTIATAEGTWTADAAGLAGVVQLPNPNHVIYELAAPLTVTDRDGATATASFTTLRGSVHLAGGDFDRATLQVEKPSLALSQPGGRTTSVDGALFDAFVRRSEGRAPGALDILAKLVDAKSPLAEASMGGSTADIELQLAATKLDAFSDGVSHDTLRDFAAAGGTLHLALLRLTQGDVVAQATGDATLDPSGSLSGTAEVTVAAIGKLVQAMSQAGVPGLYAALALGRPARLDDKPASRYALRLDGGRVSVGSVSLGRLPPLF